MMQTLVKKCILNDCGWWIASGIASKAEALRSCVWSEEEKAKKAGRNEL